MAAILSVSTWQPHPGKGQQLLAGVAAAKKIHERLGASVRVGTTQFGGTPLSVIYALEFADWSAFGAFGASLETDAEWQAMWSAAAANPSATLVSQNVSVEVAL